MRDSRFIRRSVRPHGEDFSVNKHKNSMSISTRQHMIDTSHGSLAVEETGQGALPVLLIHGNSFCRGVFRNQMHGEIAKNYRLIAFDLPGHRQSSNATDPERSYTRPGLADAAVELLDKLG
jgi:pimeloyl-ACP methyl ester carboxylesterase